MSKPIIIALPVLLKLNLPDASTNPAGIDLSRFAESHKPIGVDEPYSKPFPLLDVSRFSSRTPLLWKGIDCRFASATGEFTVPIAGMGFDFPHAASKDASDKLLCNKDDISEEQRFISGIPKPPKTRSTARSDKNGGSSLIDRQMRHELLTYEQEVEFAKQFQEGFLNTLQVICSIADSTNDEDFVIAAEHIRNCRAKRKPIRYDAIHLKAAMQKFKTKPYAKFVTRDMHRGLYALNEMIRMNYRLVFVIAKQQLSSSTRDLEDLIQEGNIGLLRGVVRFDPSRGFRLSTYIQYWIRQNIIRTEKGQIRLPVYQKEKINNIQRCYFYLRDKIGRIPTKFEVAQEMGMSIKKLDQFHLMSLTPESLSAPFGDEEDSSCLMDVLENITAENPEEMAIEDHQRKYLIDYLSSRLEARELEVLNMRFGLTGDAPKSLEEIGEQYGLSRERIRQIETKAILKLRDSLNKLIDKDQF